MSTHMPDFTIHSSSAAYALLVIYAVHSTKMTFWSGRRVFLRLSVVALALTLIHLLTNTGIGYRPFSKPLDAGTWCSRPACIMSSTDKAQDSLVRQMPLRRIVQCLMISPESTTVSRD